MRYLAECLTPSHMKMIAVVVNSIANRHKIRLFFFSIKSHVILNFIKKNTAKCYKLYHDTIFSGIEIHGIYIGNLESELERRVTI